MDFRLWLEDGRRTIKTLFERGIDRRDPSILGYHGTSVQTMRAAIERGVLPVARGLKRVFGNQNDTAYGLHVSPNMDNRIVRTLEFRNPPEPDAYKDALAWATHVSKRHSLFDMYGMDMNKSSHHRAASDIMMANDSPKSTMKRLGLDHKPRETTTAGVILAISDRVAERFRLLVGGDGNDINIITNALPVEYILGIDPADDAAYKWLDAL